MVREGIHVLPDSLALELGGRITPCSIAWRLIGPPSAPVVAVLGGISADRRVCAAPGHDEAEGWWEAQVGIRRALDLSRWRVLSIDFIGGSGRSSAPPQPSRNVIPSITPGDQAEALRAVVDHLDMPRLHGVVGASYGGAVALSFAADHAALTRSALVIGAAHRSHPMATAVRVIQRRIVAEAVARGKEREGLALARALAMTTYRSQEEFQRRFAGPPAWGPAGPRFPVENYIDHNGRAFAERFNSQGFLCLSLSMDLQDVDPQRVGIPVTLVAMEPDSIAPAWQVRDLYERLGTGHELIEVTSTAGHDGFLTDVNTFAGVLTGFLERNSRD